jgi:hypothetical protein
MADTDRGTVAGSLGANGFGHGRFAARLRRLAAVPLADGGPTLIGDVFFYPVGIAASWAAFAASRRCAGQPRLRSAWRLLAIASIVYLAGDIAQTIYETQGPDPFPSIADALYLSSLSVDAVGFAALPGGPT